MFFLLVMFLFFINSSSVDYNSYCWILKANFNYLKPRESMLNLASRIPAPRAIKNPTKACGAKEKSLGTPPTFEELGFTGQIGYMDRILMAPAKTPPERIKILQDALSKLKDDKTFKKFMKRLGENMKFMSTKFKI